MPILQLIKINWQMYPQLLDYYLEIWTDPILVSFGNGRLGKMINDPVKLAPNSYLKIKL